MQDLVGTSNLLVRDANQPKSNVMQKSIHPPDDSVYKLHKNRKNSRLGITP